MFGGIVWFFKYFGHVVPTAIRMLLVPMRSQSLIFHFLMHERYYFLALKLILYHFWISMAWLCVSASVFFVLIQVGGTQLYWYVLKSKSGKFHSLFSAIFSSPSSWEFLLYDSHCFCVLLKFIYLLLRSCYFYYIYLFSVFMCVFSKEFVWSVEDIREQQAGVGSSITWALGFELRSSSLVVPLPDEPTLLWPILKMILGCTSNYILWKLHIMVSFDSDIS